MRPVQITVSGAKKYYYEKDPIRNQDGKGENTRWAGKGAAELGLEGRVTKDKFEAVLESKHPTTGEVLVEYKTRVVDGQEQERRAGVDIPFSAPKSVSLLALHMDDDRLITAHEKAVQQTITYLEKNGYAQYRETVDGVTSVKKAEGFTCSTHGHSLSRMNDPQLHDHVIFHAFVKTPSGEYRALHADAIFRDQQYVSSIYDSFLAKNVVELGYALEQKSNGRWEVAGVPQEMIDRFSKRSADIEEAEQQLRENDTLPYASPGQINKAATLESRPEKDKKITAEECKEVWDAEDLATRLDKKKS